MEPAAMKTSSTSRAVLVGRRFLTCRECGWVHYVMTAEEKVASDSPLERYHLSANEWRIYEASYRQCLRCEAPADDFRAAEEDDLARAAGHLVTPVFVDATIGTA